MNARITLAASLFAGCVLLATQAIAAPIYKWVDENGQTHFSQQPPNQGASEKVQTRASSVVSNEAEHAANAAQQEATEQIQDIQNTAEKVADNAIKKDAELCQKAQNNKNTIISRPIIRKEGKLLSIEERNKELQYLEEVISIHC